MNTPQAIRGTQDIFGAEAEAFAHVVETFERVRKLYRFRRVEMPVFEKTEVFSRSIGETTDVVSKEMYSFEDRGGESLTLRPEFTAGICRAFLTNGWQQHAPLKVATHNWIDRGVEFIFVTGGPRGNALLMKRARLNAHIPPKLVVGTARPLLQVELRHVVVAFRFVTHSLSLHLT